MTPIILLALIPYSAALTAFVVFQAWFISRNEGWFWALLAAALGVVGCAHVLLMCAVVTAGFVIFFGG